MAFDNAYALNHIHWLKSLAGRHFGSVGLKRRLAGLNLTEIEIVDCGCGLNNTVVSRQVLSLPLKRLVGVDGFPAAIEEAAKLSCRSAQRELLCLSLQDLPAHFGFEPCFDVALCLDVIEHLPKVDAFEFLCRLESIVRHRIILWLPLGEYQVDAHPRHNGNPLAKHVSYWSREDIADLGYQTELVRGFHWGRYDALWATKDLAQRRRAFRF